MTGFGTVVANQDPKSLYHVCIRHIVPRDSDLKRHILSKAIIQLSFTAYVRRTVDPVQHQICYQDRQYVPHRYLNPKETFLENPQIIELPTILIPSARSCVSFRERTTSHHNFDIFRVMQSQPVAWR